MKKVNIHIICDFRKGQASPWEVLLRSGNHERSISGKHKARTEGGLKTYALKLALQEIKYSCHIDVFTTADGLKDLVLEESKPEMLEKCMSEIGQFFWVRESDLSSHIISILERLRTA